MTLSLYLPFIFGVGLVLVQPVMDKVWIFNYDKREATDDHRTTVVQWATDVAAFFPSSIPVVLGAVLLLADKSHSPTSNDFLVVALIFAALIIVALFIAAGFKAVLQPIMVWKYTGLQVILLLLNAAGILVAFLAKDDDSVVLTCVKHGTKFACTKGN